MGNKYSSRRESSPIVPLAPVRFESITPPVQAPVPQLVVREEEMVRAVLKRLRTVRDSGEFKQENCHSFREWAQKKFGQNLGIFVDEML